MIRCNWEMPANDLVDIGARCVKYADHGSVHVIPAFSGNAVTYWQIKTRKRTIQAIMHCDLRDNSRLNDEECFALYHFMRVARKAT